MIKKMFFKFLDWLGYIGYFTPLFWIVFIVWATVEDMRFGEANSKKILKKLRLVFGVFFVVIFAIYYTLRVFISF